MASSASVRSKPPWSHIRLRTSPSGRPAKLAIWLGRRLVGAVPAALLQPAYADMIGKSLPVAIFTPCTDKPLIARTAQAIAAYRAGYLACIAGRAGLATLSAERLRMEMLKLMVAEGAAIEFESRSRRRFDAGTTGKP